MSIMRTILILVFQLSSWTSISLSELFILTQSYWLSMVGAGFKHVSNMFEIRPDSGTMFMPLHGLHVTMFLFPSPIPFLMLSNLTWWIGFYRSLWFIGKEEEKENFSYFSTLHVSLNLKLNLKSFSRTMESRSGIPYDWCFAFNRIVNIGNLR